MDFFMDSALSINGILCTSPNFQSSGACVGNVPGNTSVYLHNSMHSDALYFSYTFNKCKIAPSGKVFSPYNISYKNSSRLPDVFNY